MRAALIAENKLPQIKKFEKSIEAPGLKLPTTNFRLLKRLVEIDSATENVQGVNRVQLILLNELVQLGFKAQLIKIPDPNVKSGHLLVAEIPGREKGYINLVGHADTVLSTNFHDQKLKCREGRAIGSGVIDDKGGLVVALAALKKYLQNLEGPLEYGIRFICSPNEEMGSPGFHSLFKEFSKDAKVILGFEPACGGNGDVVISRKGNRWYDIHFKGKKAHAGRDFIKGVNACSELTHKIFEIHKLTDLERGVTVNIGKISGGSKHNVVSDVAYAQLDVRFEDFESRDEVIEKIDHVLESDHGQVNFGPEKVSFEYEIVDDCPPFEATEASKMLFEKYSQILQQTEGRKPKALKVGGASDCNYLSGPGKIILDGLGPIGGGMHTDSEYIELDSLETRSAAVTELLNFINQI